MANLILIIFAGIGALAAGGFAGVLILGGRLYIRSDGNGYPELEKENERLYTVIEDMQSGLWANHCDSCAHLKVELQQHKTVRNFYLSDNKKLKDAIQLALSWTWDCSEGNMLEVIAALNNVLEDLYHTDNP
ncbi:hypothetical protein [Paenibacillus sp. FSL L8-0708]|uniref:hypothetical protein n=1 Tax=Paenibacillus sp. FSL L8-0708 TaxID=2975311 RepID=UPI0030F67731